MWLLICPFLPWPLSFDHSDAVSSFKPKELGALSFSIGGVHKFYPWQLKSGLSHPAWPVFDSSTSSSCSPVPPYSDPLLTVYNFVVRGEH